MAFSPEDIESKRFLTDLRGYDKAEVDAFLRELAGELRQLLQQLEHAKEGRVQEPGPDAFHGVAEGVESIMRAANEEAQRLIAAAGEEREALLAEVIVMRERAEDELKRAQALRAAAEEEASPPAATAQATPAVASFRRFVDRWSKRPSG